MTALLLATLASAQTIAVVTTAAGGVVPEEAVRSTAWHALLEQHGHRALVLNGPPEEAVMSMQRHHITTLVQLDVSWRPEAVAVDGGVLFGEFPVVEVTEHALRGEGLRAVHRWSAQGAVALYRTLEGSEGFVSLPEVALQEAVAVAVSPITPPIWQAPAAEPFTVPVVVAADEEYRTFYQERWRSEVARRVARASGLLEQAGFALRIVGYTSWTSPDGAHDLSELLEHLAEQPLSDGPIRIGITQQTRLEQRVERGAEDVGRAHVPGRDVLVADQALTPQHDVAWDVADEGVAIAHELLHALGVPHTEERHVVMSATKESSVYRLASGTRQLARAAAQARYAHWDAVLAVHALSQAADAWIEDPDLQLDYVTANLLAGPGMPAPGSLAPERVSALTNVVVGQYYISRSHTASTDAAALRQVGREHTLAAVIERPHEAKRLLEMLDGPDAPPWMCLDDEPRLRACPSQ